MKSSLPALILALFVPLMSLAASADGYKVGDSFIGFSAPDQHGTTVAYKAGDAKFILFDTPGESGQSQHPQDPDWFANNHVFLVVSISGLSSIKRKIAHSRMKSKPFKLLIVDDTRVAQRFPTQNGKFTVLVLDKKGIITGIKYAAPGPELKEVVTGTKD